MVTMVKTEQPTLAQPTIEQLAEAPVELLWRLSVDQYHAMIQAGILQDDDPVELLEGYLVQKMPKKPLHRASTRLLRQALERLIPDGWYVDSQEPITTADSEPEPDITVVRGDTLDYLDRHPSPHEVGLVVEVADATLQRDRGTKKRLYARAGVTVYWLVNVGKQQIEVYTQPVQTGKQPDYRQRQVYQMTDTLPVLLDGVEVGRIAVYEVLPQKG
jgi:Uma2 family endonuclease